MPPLLRDLALGELEREREADGLVRDLDPGVDAQRDARVADLDAGLAGHHELGVLDVHGAGDVPVLVVEEQIAPLRLEVRRIADALDRRLRFRLLAPHALLLLPRRLARGPDRFML